MSKHEPGYLSKREQQIMDAIYLNGSATANEVMEALPDSPGNATVRKLLKILEEKGRLTHVEEQGTFRYRPAVSKKTAAKGALQRLVQTFFAGSLSDAVAGLIDAEEENLSDHELEEMQRLIDKARASRSKT